MLSSCQQVVYICYNMGGFPDAWSILLPGSRMPNFPVSQMSPTPDSNRPALIALFPTYLPAQFPNATFIYILVHPTETWPFHNDTATQTCKPQANAAPKEVKTNGSWARL